MLCENIDAGFRLETKRRDVARTGVEVFERRGFRREPAVAAIPVADSPAKLHVGASAAGELDEAILVESGNASGGGLSSDPIGLLRQAHGVTARR